MTTDNGPKLKSARASWLPLAILLACMALVFVFGGHKILSLKTIGLNYEALKMLIIEHLGLAILIYFVVYVAVVALSLPGGLVMTLAGGLFFGWKLATPLTVVAATVGATIVFLVARTSVGEPLAAKAGPWLGKLREGFRENALSYLLFLRLVPAFPFVVVNLAPALLGVPLRTYVLGTFLGIIPGTVAFTVTGSGLASVIKAQNRAYAECLAKALPNVTCPYKIDKSVLLTKEVVAAFVLLGVLALITVIIKRWNKRHAAA